MFEFFMIAVLVLLLLIFGGLTHLATILNEIAKNTRNESDSHYRYPGPEATGLNGDIFTGIFGGGQAKSDEASAKKEGG